MSNEEYIVSFRLYRKDLELALGLLANEPRFRDLQTVPLAASVAKPNGPRTSSFQLPPKYRNPDTGETWAGRGVWPTWMREKLKHGARIGDFEIGGKPQEPPRKPSVRLVLAYMQTRPTLQWMRRVIVKQMEKEGFRETSASSAIVELVSQGLAQRDAEGIYSLTEKGKTTDPETVNWEFWQRRTEYRKLQSTASHQD